MDDKISTKFSHQRIFLPAVTAAAVTVALVTFVVLLRGKRGRARPASVVATETAAGAREARSLMVRLKLCSQDMSPTRYLKVDLIFSIYSGV